MRSPTLHPWSLPWRLCHHSEGQTSTDPTGDSMGRVGPARAQVGVWRSDGVTGPTHEESYHLLSAAWQAGHKRGHRPGLSLAKASIGRLSPLVTNNTRSLWEIQQIDSGPRRMTPPRPGSHHPTATWPHLRSSCSRTGHGHTFFKNKRGVLFFCIPGDLLLLLSELGTAPHLPMYPGGVCQELRSLERAWLM